MWDVIESCEIHGSSDSSIKNVKPNDIKKILNNSSIKHIFVVGKKAYQLYNKYILNDINIEVTCLSSTSPANASKKLDDLVEEFRIILNFLK